MPVKKVGKKFEVDGKMYDTEAAANAAYQAMAALKLGVQDNPAEEKAEGATDSPAEDAAEAKDVSKKPTKKSSKKPAKKAKK